MNQPPPPPPHPTVEAALKALARRESISREHASEVMELVMTGQVTGAQFGALMMGLLLKGESVEEIAGLASVMQAKAVPVEFPGVTVDTCGTGGDGSDSFNVSTTSAFVVSGTGVQVAKHGNRAMSSQCGSADVLEALGARIELDAAQVELVMRESGMAFMFAPLFHPAMHHAIGPRREMRVRTVFNILGPLVNPARARHQVIGVADGTMAHRMAQVLRELGSDHALVVHGRDGLDELSIAAPSQVFELRGGDIRTYMTSPEECGVPRASLDELRGGDSVANATITRAVLAGEPGACRDVVLLNSAAALVAADRVGDLKEGVVVARQSIDSGAAAAKLDAFVASTTAAAAAAGVA
jgi:anthranilate phosphoribosyltransferase